MHRRVSLCLLAGGLVLLAGCDTPPREALAAPAPPPPVPAETVPLPPVTEERLIWQPGHWDWTGSRYLWREGRWVSRRDHGVEWQPGYWTREGDGWSWVPAHWF